jgi:hypothetical protein
MADRTVQCGDCGRDLDESPNEPNRMPCAACGSTRRAINISVIDEIHFREHRSYAVDGFCTVGGLSSSRPRKLYFTQIPALPLCI